jgi:hypothetical protein
MAVGTVIFGLVAIAGSSTVGGTAAVGYGTLLYLGHRRREFRKAVDAYIVCRDFGGGTVAFDPAAFGSVAANCGEFGHGIVASA